MPGAPQYIVRRSGGLFFLTTAVNAASIVAAGVLLSTGVSHPNQFSLAELPALAVIAVTTGVIFAAHVVDRRPNAVHWVRALAGGVRDAEGTTFHNPSWRLVGALAYLGCDMAVLGIALAAVGHPMSIPALVLAYNIGYLANALPIPGGIGVLDAGLAGALLLYGATPGHVIAGVLLYHAIALWVPGLGGLLAYVRVRPRLTESGGAIRPAPPTKVSSETRRPTRPA